MHHQVKHSYADKKARTFGRIAETFRSYNRHTNPSEALRGLETVMKARWEALLEVLSEELGPDVSGVWFGCTDGEVMSDLDYGRGEETKARPRTVVRVDNTWPFRALS